MSVKYRISPELNLVVFVGEGAVTGGELLQAVSASYADPLRVQGMMNILDMLDARDEMELNDLRAILELEKMVRKRKSVVMLAVLSLSKGMEILANAMTLMSNGTIEVEVFQEIHAACNWLGCADEDAVTAFWNSVRL